MDLTDLQWTIIEPLFEEKWPPVARRACGAQRGAVGLAHRRAVVRPEAQSPKLYLMSREPPGVM
jgi:hypothetical protein